MDREKRTLQYRSFSCGSYTEAQKCVNFVLNNGLSKNCRRKYWLTDRSPNPTWTFSEVRNFWTPIFTFNSAAVWRTMPAAAGMP